MITRKFEQEWDEIISPINRRVENNVIYDFFDYIVNMHKDLKALKKDYEKEFNAISKKDLDFYFRLFEKRAKQYATLCISNYSQTKMWGSNQTYKDFYDGIIIKNGSHYKISDKYYPVLKKIAESIFTIEDEMSTAVSKIWQKEFTDINKYNKNGKYFLLAHNALNTADYNNLDNEIKEYFNQQKGMCFSLITEYKTKLYNGANTNGSYTYYPEGFVGIIAKPKEDGIIAISMDDMLSTEYINGKCPYNKVFHHSNINTCYENGKSKICCRGTKICPPKEIFNISVDTINEIVLDKNKMDVEAVFYVTNGYNEIPKNFEAYKAAQEKLCGHKLKVIQLVQRNKLNQIDLDEIYNNN